jgi:hypothetical protein
MNSDTKKPDGLRARSGSVFGAYVTRDSGIPRFENNHHWEF